MSDGERLRLFVALPLPEETVERLVAWQREALGGVGGLRVVPPPNLHITLAFLGSRPLADVERIVGAMRDAAARIPTFELVAERYRETQRVGMVVLSDTAPASPSRSLAARVQRRLERLGVYAPEARPWTPHVTVARFSERPRLALDPPDLGAFSPSEVALYHSVLRPSGAQYEIRESVALGG